MRTMKAPPAPSKAGREVRGMEELLPQEELEKEIEREKARRKVTRRLEDKYPVGSRVIPFEMPKYAKRILAHLADCFAEHHCVLCSDCLAFALLFIEEAPPLVRGQPYIIRADAPYSQFIKFLCSTLPGEPGNLRYNPCPYNQMNYDDVRKFALYLLRLPPEKRRELRHKLLCHAEFHIDRSPPRHRKLGRVHEYK